MVRGASVTAAAAHEEAVRALFQDLNAKAGGRNVAELFGVGVQGSRLDFKDFRSPDEVVRTHATRRMDISTDGYLAPFEVEASRERGRRRLAGMLQQQQGTGGRRTPPGHSGGSTSDDISKACNQIRCMGPEIHEMAVIILEKARKDEAMQTRTQSELLSLLGDDNIDMIMTLINCREACIDNLMEELQDQYETLEKDEQAQGPMSNFTVRYERDIRQQKKDRRDLKAGRTAAHHRQQEVLRKLANERARDRRKREENARVFGKDFDQVASLEDTMKALPGCTQENKPGYIEVNVPMRERPPVDKSELYPVSRLPEWAQLAFPPAITHLNQVQTRVVETAFFSSENMLVSAPTGAGKTNCALLAMLQEIGTHVQPDGSLAKEEFKMVYIAPMKALAQEMVDNFGKKLSCYGLVVKELTGDAQLTKREMAESHLIITTPEKWDVVTRKNTEALVNTTNLVIFDEVHLLNEDRGPVIEVLVARLLRRSQVTQKQTRLVGLSATLPNYRDVSTFLGCSSLTGLFVFDAAFRPVPLQQTFIGIQEKARNAEKAVRRPGEDPQKDAKSADQSFLYDEICFDRCCQALQNDKQVMIFVHARKKAFTVAKTMKELAIKRGKERLFLPDQQDAKARRQVGQCKNPMIEEIFPSGLGIHHAGLLKHQRRLMEQLFAQGHIKVLCCTATLAWGVNLPAHTVIIHGTKIYNAQRGGWVDVGILDVMQIFGRAGRPQFDTSGHGIILTSQEQLPRYLSSLTHTAPIESKLNKKLTDHLNAEIVLGNVSSPEEAWSWFQYTYLYIRLKKNPRAYGRKPDLLYRDPEARGAADEMLREACKALDQAEMCRFEEDTSMDNLHPTVVGRIASHFYISHETIHRWTAQDEGYFARGRSIHDMGGALVLISQAAEFDQIQVREEEMPELLEIRANYCILESTSLKQQSKMKAGGDEKDCSSAQTKTRTLIQAWIANVSVQTYSLMNDMQYIADNTGRICRALTELSLHREIPSSVDCFLTLAKMIEKRAWHCYPEVLQFGELPNYIADRLKDKQATVSRLQSLSVQEIGALLKNWQVAPRVKEMADFFPQMEIRHEVAPITATIIRVKVELICWCRWSPRHHGQVEPWHIFVQDYDASKILHKDFVLFTKKEVNNPRWDVDEKQLIKKELNFTLPVHDGNTHLTIRAVSDRWVNAEGDCDVVLNHICPNEMKPFTELLPINPLELKHVLVYPKYRQVMKFTHLNPVQSQCFHQLYHQDGNVLFGAPTGSGKTVAAELAMFRVFNLAAEVGKDKVVYIAPLKALVKERMRDWTKRFHDVLGKTVLELSGDHTPDVGMLNRADILCCTPEKWDGISRSWQSRSYVQGVALIVLDEIHMLGGDRGPILEVIVSRMRYMGWHLGRKVRVVGLSTALANAIDLASWMGIEGVGLYNFRPQVRPIPLEMHIQGYPGRHYCPRMATMNKPCFTAIEKHARILAETPHGKVSSVKPVIVFVSSRRQTRLTALDLINFLNMSADPTLFTNEIEPEELSHYVSQCADEHLRHTLSFGIGIHHAGLTEGDKDIMEHMFVTQKLRVLVATSTLAWGVNFPAHLVIIKGTEFYDAKTKTYVDYSLTDVLQMMGRAGRPQFDTSGKAIVMVHEPKKTFYKKFVHDPFPVESSLHKNLHEHINAEIVAGTIAKRQDAIDYLTWTYLFRRLYRNPSYYGLESPDHQAVSRFLSSIVEKVVRDLTAAKCLEEADPADEEADPDALVPSVLGRIASFYYMSYTSVLMFEDGLAEDATLQDVLKVLTEATEFAELPVRHNEDKLNADLARHVPLQVDTRLLDSPHVKTHLLLQAHFSQAPLPISDYATDTKSVLENAIRVVQAMVDISANNGYLYTCLRCMNLLQMLVQGCWLHDNTLMQLPHIRSDHLGFFREKGITCIAELLSQEPCVVLHHLKQMGFSLREEGDIRRAARMFPVMDCRLFYDVEEEDGEQQIKVTVELLRVSDVARHVHSPRFPKPKDEQWWVVLGDPATGELLALKRINRIREFVSTSLVFEWDEEWDEDIKDVTGPDGRRAPGRSFALYAICDSYVGCDMQYAFDVVRPQAPAGGDGEEEGEEA